MKWIVFSHSLVVSPQQRGSLPVLTASGTGVSLGSNISKKYLRFKDFAKCSSATSSLWPIIQIRTIWLVERFFDSVLPTEHKGSLYRWLVLLRSYDVLNSALLTREIAVVILVPPDAPITKRAWPFLSKNIDGAVEDIGRFPGSIILDSDGSTP